MLSTLEVPVGAAARHRWLLRPQPDAAVEALRAFVVAFRDFAALGSGGAFVSRDADTTSCAMHIRDQRRLADNSLEFLVDVVDCDPRYARVLRNIMFGTGQSLDSPVLEFRVDSAEPRGSIRRLEAEVDEETVEQFYPELAARLTSLVRFEQPANYQSGRRMSITCTGDLSIPLVDDLTKLVDLWASVVPTGFPSSEAELIEGQSFILNVTGCQHDEITYEVLIEDFIAAEAALSTLLNLVAGRASRDTQIVGVVAE